MQVLELHKTEWQKVYPLGVIQQWCSIQQRLVTRRDQSAEFWQVPSKMGLLRKTSSSLA